MTSNAKPDDIRLVLVGNAPPPFTAAVLGPWARNALCAKTNPEIFFPAHDDPATEARQICARCPVRDDCLRFALENNERYGIWGGLDPGERDSLRCKQRQQKQRTANRRGAA
jgi:WhiB family redox-sensing transcriptional regulator